MTNPLVLAVDDDPSLLKLMVRRLDKLGLQIEQASDGRSALELIESNTYDLVVTDIYMPGVTGLELLKQAKEREQHTQVIVVTAAATMENAVEALNNGAFAYLTKPFDHMSVFDNVVSRATTCEWQRSNGGVAICWKRRSPSASYSFKNGVGRRSISSHVYQMESWSWNLVAES